MSQTMMVLETAATSVVLERRAEAPAWRRWGPRVGTAGLPPLAETWPAASFSLDVASRKA